MGGPKYAVGMDKNGRHYTFVFINENFEYDLLKNIVLKILDEEVKPTSSSRKGN
ncbi:hypothetical protein [Aestuariivivens insulae]|uniref:hypothetical protein n=1 Tax=Aestuariivivens insulae TaxID=1621988 RepID=UPI001F56EFAD|nr:hypothetical protein [Aestuariivivens insulae]